MASPLVFEFGADLSKVVQGLQDFVARGAGAIDQLRGKITTTFDGVASHAGKSGGEAGRNFAQQFSQHANTIKEKFGESFKSGLGILGGGALLGAGAGLGVLFKDTLEKGKDQVKLMSDLRLGFEQAGLSGKELGEQLKRTDTFADSLSRKFAIDDDRIKELSKSAAVFGGATGKMNEDIVKMALGMEKATGGTISADRAIRMLSKGAADPENADALNRLKGIFPQLFAAMTAGGTATEKMDLAFKALQPTFNAMERSANGPLGSMRQFEIAFENVQKTVGAAIITAIGPIMKLMGDLAGLIQDYVLPAVTALGEALGSFGPIVSSVVGGVMLLVGGLTVYNTVMGLSFIQTVKNAAVEALHTAAKIAGAVATGALTVATWALNAAMVVLTSPITLIVAGIAALIAGLVYAYKHSETFRNIVDAVAASIWNAVKFWAEWLNPIGLSIKLFQILYEKVGIFRDAFDGVIGTAKAVGGFFAGLWQSVFGTTEAVDKNTEAARGNVEALKAEEEQIDKTRTSFDKLAEAALKASKDYAQQREAEALRGGASYEQAEALRKKIELEGLAATVRAGKARIAQGIEMNDEELAAYNKATIELAKAQEERRKSLHKSNKDNAVADIEKFLAEQRAKNQEGAEKEIAELNIKYNEKIAKAKGHDDLIRRLEAQRAVDLAAIVKKYDAEDAKNEKDAQDKKRDAKNKAWQLWQSDNERHDKLEADKAKAHDAMLLTSWQRSVDAAMSLAHTVADPLVAGFDSAFSAIKTNFFDRLTKNWDVQNNYALAFFKGVIEKATNTLQTFAAGKISDAILSMFRPKASGEQVLATLRSPAFGKGENEAPTWASLFGIGQLAWAGAFDDARNSPKIVTASGTTGMVIHGGESAIVLNSALLLGRASGADVQDAEVEHEGPIHYGHAAVTGGVTAVEQVAHGLGAHVPLLGGPVAEILIGASEAKGETLTEYKRRLAEKARKEGKEAVEDIERGEGGMEGFTNRLIKPLKGIGLGMGFSLFDRDVLGAGADAAQEVIEEKFVKPFSDTITRVGMEMPDKLFKPTEDRGMTAADRGITAPPDSAFKPDKEGEFNTGAAAAGGLAALSGIKSGKASKTIGGLLGILGAIPGIGLPFGLLGGIIGGLGSIFGFADGGIVTSPVMGMIGEAGSAEAIIPLNHPNASAMLSSLGGGGNAGLLSLIAKQNEHIQRLTTQVKIVNSFEGTMRASGSEMYSAISHNTTQQQITRA